jgi:peptidoglycan/xylan/chitin deacetylase (PgdA/CDA1 family)
MADNPLYPYSPIAGRPPLRLPGGKRLAVWIGVANEHFLFGRRALSLVDFTADLPPDPLNHGWRDYGPRVGTWRLMDLFDRYRIPVTSLLNGDVVTEHPEIVAAGVERGWAFVGHGATNSTFLLGLTRDEERAEIARITEQITEATGTRPRGWIGPALTESEHTGDILTELGYTYTVNWGGIDDEPVRMASGLLAMPYSAEVNDLPAFVVHHHTAPEFRDMLIDQFDQLLAEGADRPRVMGFGVHPFLVGQPYRARHFARALEHMTGHRDEVWFTTADGLASWYNDARGNGDHGKLGGHGECYHGGRGGGG